jgi:hypothetical protein
MAAPQRTPHAVPHQAAEVRQIGAPPIEHQLRWGTIQANHRYLLHPPLHREANSAAVTNRTAPAAYSAMSTP